MSLTERPRSPWLRWLPAALAAALLLLLMVPLVLRLRFADTIMPGVRVSGVDLGGSIAEQARERLRAAGLDPAEELRLMAESETLRLAPGVDGIGLDESATLAAAMAAGRERGLLARTLGPLRAALLGREVAPVVSVDEAALAVSLARLAKGFDRPPRDAAIELDGATPRAVEAKTGRQLDQAQAFAGLREVASRGQWPITDFRLPVAITAPAVQELGAAMEQAQALLRAPITLRAGDQTWELTPRDLAPLLRPSPDGGTVRLSLDSAALAEWMAPITAVVSRTAELPRFAFLPDDRRLTLIKAGQRGQRLDLAAAAAQILDAGSNARLVRLPLVYEEPAAKDTATAAELGIQEVVGQATSRFSGSAPGRVHNVALAASQFHGLLIPPDAVFSFNEHLGDVSEEMGYKKTLIIVDGATQDGVGGGVCQVSTTLFRAAFWAGLPIVERHAHGYRVGYYEQGAPPGFDATIFSPVVDLKLRNDTGHWLLIATGTNKAATTTSFTLYGTAPAREVKMGPVVKGKSVPPPPPRTELDPEMPPGASEIKEYARDGLGVSLTRIIVEGGQEREDVFRSNYVPTGLLVAVGPQAEGAATPPSP